MLARFLFGLPLFLTPVLCLSPVRRLISGPSLFVSRRATTPQRAKRSDAHEVGDGRVPLRGRFADQRFFFLRDRDANHAPAPLELFDARTATPIFTARGEFLGRRPWPAKPSGPGFLGGVDGQRVIVRTLDGKRLRGRRRRRNGHFRGGLCRVRGDGLFGPQTHSCDCHNHNITTLCLGRLGARGECR